MTNPQYLFFTYGEPGWRGVQVRGLRIASYFKKEEVLFWNGGDSGFIKSADFPVETVDLSLIHPSQINIPLSIETVIFTDLPTNELFQFSLFIAARNQNKKIVVLDQAYRRGQAQEFVYKQIAQNCDLLLLNSLSFLESEAYANVKIVPPLIEVEPEEDVKTRLGKRWKLPIDVPWLFGIGYHQKVKEKIDRVAQRLYKKNILFHLIFTGSSNEEIVSRTKYSTTLPYQLGDDFFRFIKAADLAFIKFGFLQLIEVLALGVYPLVLGEAGYVLKKKGVVDKKIQEAIYLTEEIDDKLFAHIEKFLTQPRFRHRLISKVKRLHNGALAGGRVAACYIKKLSRKKTFAKTGVKKPKRLAILVNRELKEYKDYIKNSKGVYIVGFITSAPIEPYIIKRPDEDLLASSIDQLIDTQEKEILPHSFKETYILSRRKYDGLTEIIPWYEVWVDRIQQLIDETDIIYLTGLGKSLFKNILASKKLKSKVQPLRPILSPR